MRRVLLALVVVCLAAAAGVWIQRNTAGAPRAVAFDLAARLPFAARASAREVLMFGWPDAEPHVGPGLDGDPETRGRERFLWARQGASLTLAVAEPLDRALIFDLEVYQGIESQRLEVKVNGRSLGVQDVSSTRSRVRFDWPATAQAASNTVDLRSRSPSSRERGTRATSR